MGLARWSWNPAKIDCVRTSIWLCTVSATAGVRPPASGGSARTARMKSPQFLAALACGSFAMGFAFGFLGMSYLDNPTTGLILSAAIPLAVWPPVHYLMRRPAPQPVVVESSGNGAAPGGGEPFPDRT